MTFWLWLAGVAQGYVLAGHTMRIRLRAAELRSNTKGLSDVLRARQSLEARREECKAISGTVEVEWASSGCDLTDQILEAARDKGINPGEFLDNH